MCTALFWEPEGNRTLGTASRRWEDNFKMYLKEIVCEGVNGIILAQDTTK